jgi:hypothetical protein
MTEEVAPPVAAPASPKKGKGSAKATAKKPKTAPSHPKVSEMITTAIKTLKERSGSSTQAIKKYIAANYKVDIDRLTPFIKKYLKSAVESGALTQTKGVGASGSFRIAGAAKPASTGKPKKAAAKPATKKPKSATPKKAKAAAAAKPKKAAAEKKVAKKPKASAPKKAKTVKKPKAVTPKKPKAPKAAKKTPVKKATKTKAKK